MKTIVSCYWIVLTGAFKHNYRLADDRQQKTIGLFFVILSFSIYNTALLFDTLQCRVFYFHTQNKRAAVKWSFSLSPPQYSLSHPPRRLLALSSPTVTQPSLGMREVSETAEGGATESYRPVPAIQSTERGGWRKKTNWVGRSLFLARRKTKRRRNRWGFKHHLSPLV